MTGVCEVRVAGGGEETIILTEIGSGTLWELSGDVASELRQSWGQTVTASGALLPPDGEPASGLHRLEVTDYSFEGEPDGESSEP